MAFLVMSFKGLEITPGDALAILLGADGQAQHVRPHPVGNVGPFGMLRKGLYRGIIRVFKELEPI